MNTNKVGNIEVGSIVKITHIGGEFIFARVEKFSPDVMIDWYAMEFTMLLFSPEQCSKISWLLRAPQINGEQFEIGSKKMIIDLILPPICPIVEPPNELPKEGKIIPFRREK